jgi:hypothetical protein
MSRAPATAKTAAFASAACACSTPRQRMVPKLLANQTVVADRPSVPYQSDVWFTIDLAEATGCWSLWRGVWHSTAD